MKPLRILSLSPSDRYGGAEKVAFDLHRTYRVLGHQSVLGVLRKHSDDADVLPLVSERALKLIQKGNTASTKAFGLESLWGPHPESILRQARGRLGTPDVIHAHNTHGASFRLGTLSALSQVAPVVVTMHDNWWQTGHCAYHLGCHGWRFGCGDCPDLGIYPAIGVDATALNWRRKAKEAAAIRGWFTAPSRWLCEEARQGLLRDRPIRFIANGTDLDVFRPWSKEKARKALDLPAKRPLILFNAASGLTNAFKDGPTLLAALRQVVARHPDVLLVALGGQANRQLLKGLGGHVVVRDYAASPDDVARYYQAADILALATKADNAPLVILEAMACGLPVVASRVGGIPEYVHHGENGLLVSPKDAEGLAAALIQLVEGPALRKRLGKKAQDCAQRDFGLETQAKHFLELFVTCRQGP